MARRGRPAWVRWLGTAAWLASLMWLPWWLGLPLLLALAAARVLMPHRLAPEHASLLRRALHWGLPGVLFASQRALGGDLPAWLIALLGALAGYTLLVGLDAWLQRRAPRAEARSTAPAWPQVMMETVVAVETIIELLPVDWQEGPAFSDPRLGAWTYRDHALVSADGERFDEVEGRVALSPSGRWLVAPRRDARGVVLWDREHARRHHLRRLASQWLVSRAAMAGAWPGRHAAGSRPRAGCARTDVAFARKAPPRALFSPPMVFPSRISAHTCAVDIPDHHRSPFSLALSVIIVSADSGPALRDCVRQVLASSLSLELILVDNASQDGIAAAIERAHAHDPRLTVIYNHRNLGFGPAVNLAAKKANGKAVLVLNPDCLVKDDDLRRLLAVLDSRPRVGLVGSVVCDAQGRPDPASWRRDPLLGRALNSLLGRAGESINMPGEIPAEVIEAEAVSGAVMLLPREMFQRLGGFDEGYFLHCEDLDLCRRVRDLGYQVLLAGDVRVLHGKGSSSRHRPVFVSRHKHRGMWRWFRKHDPAARKPAGIGVGVAGHLGAFPAADPRATVAPAAAPMNASRRIELLATLGLLAMTAVWGSTFVLIKDVVARMPVADFLAVRFAIGALVMLRAVRAAGAPAWPASSCCAGCCWGRSTARASCCRPGGCR